MAATSEFALPTHVRDHRSLYLLTLILTYLQPRIDRRAAEILTGVHEGALWLRSLPATTDADLASSTASPARPARPAMTRDSRICPGSEEDLCPR